MKQFFSNFMSTVLAVFVGIGGFTFLHDAHKERQVQKADHLALLEKMARTTQTYAEYAKDKQPLPSDIHDNMPGDLLVLAPISSRYPESPHVPIIRQNYKAYVDYVEENFAGEAAWVARMREALKAL